MREPAMPDNTVVGMVGIGDMGAAIAASILRNHASIVFDARPGAVEELVALGVRGTDSLELLADQCYIVILAVRDDQQLERIVGELLRRPGRLRAIIVSSPVLPSTVVALSEQALKVGLDLIDAFPLTTGRLDAIFGMLA
jgi:3-hydroxyisobutyrate dehydrogenase-like beta-hydroxyacid dehydrogenase